MLVDCNLDFYYLKEFIMRYLLLVMYFFSAVSFASHCSGGSERDHDHSEETSEAKANAVQWIKRIKKLKARANVVQWIKRAKKKSNKFVTLGVCYF